MAYSHCIGERWCCTRRVVYSVLARCPSRHIAPLQFSDAHRPAFWRVFYCPRKSNDRRRHRHCAHRCNRRHVAVRLRSFRRKACRVGHVCVRAAAVPTAGRGREAPDRHARAAGRYPWHDQGAAAGLQRLTAHQWPDLGRDREEAGVRRGRGKEGQRRTEQVWRQRRPAGRRAPRHAGSDHRHLRLPAGRPAPDDGPPAAGWPAQGHVRWHRAGSPGARGSARRHDQPGNHRGGRPGGSGLRRIHRSGTAGRVRPYSHPHRREHCRADRRLPRADCKPGCA